MLQVMRFSFIHTADWQIGKQFGGLDARLAGRLEEARLDVIDRIAAVAEQHGARHVLVAGDVYDAPDLKERTLRQPLTRMAQHAGLTWVLLPGNHDTAGPGSIWSRVHRHSPAGNIVIADSAVAMEIAPGVALLPAPLTAKATLRDPTAWMDEAVTDSARLRIGLAHGAVHGFGSEGECSVPIDAGRVQHARLDYLALGDWHGMKEIGPRCWYSGTPEPDNFANSPKGHVLAVALEYSGGAAGAARIAVTPEATGHYTWARLERDIRSEADIRALDREVAALGETSSRLLIRLRLAGALPLDALEALQLYRADLDARVQHLDWDDAGVAVSGAFDPAEIAALAGGDTDLGAVISRLAAMARDSGDTTAASGSAAGVVSPEVARTALVRLLQLVREAGGPA